jgi:hypothetical protein
MLRPMFAALTVGLFTACCLRAGDEPPAAPPNPATLNRADPELAVAHADKDGTVFIRTMRRVPKAELHTEKKVKDGATFEVPIVVTQMVPEVKDEKVNLADVQVFDTEGKKIDPQTLPERLKKETIVLLSTDGEPVDAHFLSAVKEGTLILVPPVTRSDANPAPKTPVEKR